MNSKETANTQSNHSGLKGAFQRKDSIFRNWISEDSDSFKPESGRYHLYISYACPWANRCLAVRNLKGLEEHIGLSIVHPTWQRTKPESDEHAGWVFKNEGDEPVVNLNGYGKFECKDVIPDTINNAKTVREIYEKVAKDPTTYSVPVLWDKKLNTIVNNESSEIIRMFNSAFNKFAKNPKLDLYPENLRKEIDEVNDWVYHNINNGVYKSGFAKSQEAYEVAATALFDHLDKAEEILSKRRYLAGDQLTEADIRLFMTLVRFDEVYVVYFKCNMKRIADYPNLSNYTRELYQIPEIGKSINMWHIKTHYYTSHPTLNAYAIVPIGPDVIEDLKKPHNRGDFKPKF